MAIALLLGMITTAWGQATLVEEIAVSQSNDAKEFVTHVQLLTTNDASGSEREGTPLLRFAYSTDNVARRGPVTLRVADLKKLAKSLEKAEKLSAVLAILLARGSPVISKGAAKGRSKVTLPK